VVQGSPLGCGTMAAISLRAERRLLDGCYAGMVGKGQRMGLRTGAVRKGGSGTLGLAG